MILTGGNADLTVAVDFENVLKKGSIRINKQSEDGQNGDRIFTISGGGQTYTLVTGADGTAILADIPVFDGSNEPIVYTVSENDVPVRYVVPAEQSTTLEADETVEVTFENKLKKFTAEVVKRDSENGDSQGNATLAGAVYGLYNNGERVATYTTDENGRFITDEFVCGNYTLQELSPSEGYLLNDEIYTLGTEPENYVFEMNPVSLDVTEDVKKGCISIIKHSDDDENVVENLEPGAEFEIFLKSASSFENAKEKELIPYMPAPIILAELDNAVPEVPTEEIQAETEYVKPENIQDFPDITPETPVLEAPSENVLNELRETVRNIQAVYPDTVGWLYIPDTSVNYPVMQGGDNDFYLHHAYDGSWLSSGSVFLDFRCESRFMNNLNVLYGHNMNNGSMFAGVCNFKNYGYFQAHKYGWLVTPDDVYRIDFFSAAVTDCDDEIYSGFENTADRLSHIYDISAIYEPTEISEQDRLVLLSTCSYEFENARTVLTGKLVRMEDIQVREPNRKIHRRIRIYRQKNGKI